MKALGPLAVAERDILARTTAPRRTRENRARAGDHGATPRQRPSPFQSARDEVGDTGCLDVEWSVADPTDCVPGGLEGRGVRGATRHLPNGEERPVRRARVHLVASATPIRANAVSEDMSLSDREPAEGFHLTSTTAVTIPRASENVTRTPSSERSSSTPGLPITHADRRRRGVRH